GLRAERHARRTERAPRLEPRAIEGRGVRLEGHLVRPEVERPVDRLRDRRDLVGLEEARRAAAEEGGRDARPLEARALREDLSAERLEVPGAERARRGRGREVAVRA